MSDSGIRLKEVRKILKITQKQLAERLELSQSLIGGIENGDNNLTSEHVIKLHDVFNINPNWLLVGRGDMFIEDYNEELDREVRIAMENMEQFIADYHAGKYEVTEEMAKTVKNCEEKLAEFKKNMSN